MELRRCNQISALSSITQVVENSKDDFCNSERPNTTLLVIPKGPLQVVIKT
uniref:Uncharacterized protein n=1 Tax=Arundo donax TaxID=35708 RepID=A0A0A9DRF6_ARUDO